LRDHDVGSLGRTSSNSVLDLRLPGSRLTTNSRRPEIQRPGREHDIRLQFDDLLRRMRSMKTERARRLLALASSRLR
jgi:hypothetical protein